jgi:hypothetical protein
MAESRAYPLEQFVARLREAGLAADARTLLSLQQAIHALGSAYAHRPLDLWEVMAPIVAKNREEQDKVKALWLQFCEELQRSNAPAPIAVAAPVQPPRRKLRYWWIYLIVGVVVAMALGGYFILRSLICQYNLYDAPDSTSSISDVPVIEGDTLWADTSDVPPGRLLAVSITANPDGGDAKLDTGRVMGRFYVVPQTASGLFTVEIAYTVKVETCNSDSVEQTHRHSVSYPIRCSVFPHTTSINHSTDFTTREVSFSWSGRDSGDYHYKWDFGDGDSAVACPTVHQYDSAGAYQVLLSVSSDLHPDCAPLAEVYQVDLSRKHPNKPALPNLTRAEPYHESWHQLSSLWGILLMILVWGVSGTALVLYQLNQNKKQKASAQETRQPEKIETGGPYRIPWPNQDHLVSWGGDIDRIAALMAGRITGDRLLLDVRASLRKTVEQGGFPVPAFRQLGRQQEWLFLLDEDSMNPQQKRLFTWLIGKLRSETVDVEAYWYHGSPQHCWHITDGSALTLEALSGIYSRAHLVLVTDGAGLMQPYRQELRPSLVSSLKAWHTRTLMPLRPVSEWASRERELSSFFGICPAESAGWMEYLLMPQMEGQDYAAWKKRLSMLLGNSPRWPRDPDTIEEVVDEMGDSLHSRWLCALLALPETSYEFLVAAGAAVKGSLLNWDDLVQFTRLPLLTGKLPSTAQLGLSETDKWFILGNAQAEHLLAGAQAELADKGLGGHAGTLVRRDLVMAQFRQAPKDAERQAAVRKWQMAGLLQHLPLAQEAAPAKRKGRWVLPALVSITVVLSAVLVFLMTNHFQKREVAQSEIVSLPVENTRFKVWPMKLSEEGHYQPGDSGWNQLVELYERGQMHYEEERFDSARGYFTQIDVERARSMDSVTILTDSVLFSKAMTLMGELNPSIERQRSLRLFSLYGNGLCLYYNQRLAEPQLNAPPSQKGNRGEAIRNHDLILKLCPDFYKRYDLSPPRLQTLLNDSLPGKPNPYPNPEDRQPDLTMEAVEGVPFVEVRPGREFDLGTYPTTPNNYRVRVKVSNPGDTTLILSNFRLLGFDLIAAPARTVPKRKSTYIEFSFDLSKIGAFTGSFSFKTNIKEFPTVRVPVSYEVKKAQSGGGFLYCQFNDASGKDFPMSNGQSFDLGKIDVNGEGICSMVIGAGQGSQPLQIKTITMSGSGERFTSYTRSSKETSFPVDYPLTLNFTVGAGIAQQGVTPTGRFETKLTFRTNDNQNDPFEVTIKFELVEESTGSSPVIDELIRNMVKVGDGTFQMGCTDPLLCAKDNQPARPVYMSGFKISKYEVTVEQWMEVMGKAPTAEQENCKTCAVGGVSWNEAQDFIQRLNKMTDKTFRLPTEAEWEYAARGGSDSEHYAGSNDLKVVVQEVGTVGPLRKVGQKAPNGYGLYDMSGNALEWCSDNYDEKYYTYGPDSNPKGPDPSSLNANKVIRGGQTALVDSRSYLVFTRAYAKASNSSYISGFRLVMEGR